MLAGVGSHLNPSAQKLHHFPVKIAGEFVVPAYRAHTSTVDGARVGAALSCSDFGSNKGQAPKLARPDDLKSPNPHSRRPNGKHIR
jgi:hypothetical protein